MTRHYALEAIRAQPWAILPAHLGAIEAIADRALQAPVLDILRADGHAERYRACLSAVADTGKKMDGTNSVMLNRQGVATIPVMGPIFPRANMMTEFSGATSLSSLMADLQAANASPDVSQILMVFDSPGGATTDLSNAASQIAASSKPVTAFVPGQAASAAYWLASQCSAIWMADTALVGSIGVVMSGGKQVEPDANGVMGVDVVSSNAPNKRLDVTTEDGQAQIRTVLDDLEAIFFQAVASGRNTTVDAVKQNFGRGGMKVAKSAITSGMADGVSTLADTLARLGAASPPLKPAKAAPRRAAALADLQARRKHSEGHA